MNVLYIMPWLTRPSAMSKHCNIYLNNAIEIGINPIVVSIGNDGDCKYDYDLLPITDYSNKYLAALFRRLFPDIVNHPDIYNFGTVQMGVRKILKSINFDEIDCIHSISFPCTSHLMGYEIAKATKKPWIAQFYDPWTDNPYRVIRTQKFREKDAAMERLIAENANAIVHTNNVIRDIWVERYGTPVANKIFVQPLSYEDEMIRMSENIPLRKDKSKITISYIGKLFFDRNLDDIVKAFMILKRKGIDIENNICLRVIGEITSNDLRNIKKNNLEKTIEIIGYMKRSQLHRYYLDSDAFLVIDSPQKKNVFFPSKLLDYFLYKRKVIAITPCIGVTRELIEASNNVMIENGDVNTLADYLESIINDHSLLDVVDKIFYQRFSKKSLQESQESIYNFVCSHLNA